MDQIGPLELSSADSRRAAGYATLELNGFPSWLTALAKAKPDDVREVLAAEIVAELSRPSDPPRFDILQDVARGNRCVAELMVPIVLDELEKRTTLSATVLSRVLDIAKRGLPADQDQFKRLAISRFSTATDNAISSLYISAVFSIDGRAATETFVAKLNQMPVTHQPALVQTVLPDIFGDRYEDEEVPHRNLILDSLERLVRLAFQKIRIEDDNVHPSGVVYSSDSRDRAEAARGAVFGLLTDTPGRATHETIHRLAETSDFLLLKPRLIELAKERAAKELGVRQLGAG